MSTDRLMKDSQRDSGGAANPKPGPGPDLTINTALTDQMYARINEDPNAFVATYGQVDNNTKGLKVFNDAGRVTIRKDKNAVKKGDMILDASNDILVFNGSSWAKVPKPAK